MDFKKYRNKISNILRKDYDHETPDKPRSIDYNRKILRMMKEAFPSSLGYEIFSIKGTYCYASGFIKDRFGHFVYYSFADYRFEPWERQILYRHARDEKDYTGGSNCYAYGLEDLYEKILFEFDRMKNLSQ